MGFPPSKWSKLFFAGTVLISIFLVSSGYADTDQIPEYTAATGLRKYAGYVMAFLCLAYSCRKIWIDFRDRKKP